MSSKSSADRSRNGAACRARPSSSPSAQASAADSATICWARMSSGRSGMTMASSRPWRVPRSSAAHSTSSSRVVGYSRPDGVPVRVWLERPTRCRKVAKLRGEPIWHTSSTGPTSMPSSSEAVATRARRSPARSRASTRCLRPRDSDPWCAATWAPTSSPSRSPSWWATRSAMLRVLTNTSVVRWLVTWAAIMSRICAVCSAVGTAPSSSSGSSRARSSRLRWPESTIAQRGVPSALSRSWPAPTSSRAIASIGRWVADRPTRCTGCPATCASRSRVRVRCEPRLFPATAWISSTITVRALRSMARLRSAVSSR